MSTRFLNIDRDKVCSVASFLDPRFKKKAFARKECASNCVEKVTELLRNMTPEVNNDVPSSSEHSTEGQSKSTKSNLIWGFFDESVKEQRSNITPLSSVLVELRSYSDEPLIGREDDPLAYWQKREALYPRLSKLAKRYLVIPASSVPCERVFSKAGELITDRRNRLSPTHVNELLFLNKNMILD